MSISDVANTLATTIPLSYPDDERASSGADHFIGKEAEFVDP